LFGKFIASGSFQEVILWDTQTGALRQRTPGFSDRVVALAALLGLLGGPAVAAGINACSRRARRRRRRRRKSRHGEQRGHKRRTYVRANIRSGLTLAASWRRMSGIPARREARGPVATPARETPSLSAPPSARCRVSYQVSRRSRHQAPSNR
jgi:hypothetical protein